MNGIISGNMVGGGAAPLKTVILEDENGNEVVGVVVDSPVIFTANAATDIREGKVAATNDGIVVGSKVIPSCHTSAGVKIITQDAPIEITLPSLDIYDYTQFQAIICAFNTSLNNSVAAEKVSINDKVFAVESDVSLSSVTKDPINKKIVLGVVNEGHSPVILRYFTYKEID